jgi:hypothetical protein
LFSTLTFRFSRDGTNYYYYNNYHNLKSIHIFKYCEINHWIFLYLRKKFSIKIFLNFRENSHYFSGNCSVFIGCFGLWTEFIQYGHEFRNKNALHGTYSYKAIRRFAFITNKSSSYENECRTALHRYTHSWNTRTNNHFWHSFRQILSPGLLSSSKNKVCIFTTHWLLYIICDNWYIVQNLYIFNAFLLQNCFCLDFKTLLITNKM